MPDVISRASRLCLSAKVRLRYDRKGERFMLLYPEKGLVLNPTATDVVQLCTRGQTVGAIIEQLAAKYGHDALTVEREVTALLIALRERGLVREAS